MLQKISAIIAILTDAIANKRRAADYRKIAKIHRKIKMQHNDYIRSLTKGW